jgi:FkbM family methyltransferase
MKVNLETASRQFLKRFIFGSCPGFRGRFSYFGQKVYFPKESIIFKLACQQGVYEHDNVKLLAGLANRKGMMFDVGANIGLMAIPVLYSCPLTRVISFEPSPRTLVFLKRTLRECTYSDRWQAVGKALSDRVGTLTFFSGDACLGAFDGLADTGRGGAKQKIEVPSSTLDAEWDTLGQPVISVIKIDVEGAEMQVLKGADRCINVHKPAIVLEWNATNLAAYGCEPGDLLHYASANKYRVLAVPGLVQIHELSLLETHMIYTETFLLLPN